MILGIVFLTLASDEGFFEPSYEDVALDRAFFIEYKVEHISYNYDMFSGEVNLTVLRIVNPNLKGLTEFMSHLFDAIKEESIHDLSGMIDKSFVFHFGYVSKNHLKAVGWRDEWMDLLTTPYVFEDFKGIDTSVMGDSIWREWKGKEGLRRMFRYIRKEFLLAAISGGYFVNADRKLFNELLGSLPYKEIIKRLKEETVDFNKGTYWATSSQVKKLFGGGKVQCPYFMNNLFVPLKFKVYPPDSERLKVFMPPPIVFTLRWDSQEGRWKLNSVSYGWFQIPD